MSVMGAHEIARAEVSQNQTRAEPLHRQRKERTALFSLCRCRLKDRKLRGRPGPTLPKPAPGFGNAVMTARVPLPSDAHQPTGPRGRPRRLVPRRRSATVASAGASSS